MPGKKRRKYINRADILLVALFLLIGGALGLYLMLSGKAGDKVQVRVDGDVVETFSLEQECEYEITSGDGCRNLLVIEDGSAYIAEASCPDGLCMNMGKIDKTGQSLVCLPNKVVVEIVSDDSEEQDDVDVVAE